MEDISKAWRVAQRNNPKKWIKYLIVTVIIIVCFILITPNIIEIIKEIINL